MMESHHISIFLQLRGVDLNSRNAGIFQETCAGARRWPLRSWRACQPQTSCYSAAMRRVAIAASGLVLFVLGESELKCKAFPELAFAEPWLA